MENETPSSSSIPAATTGIISKVLDTGITLQVKVLIPVSLAFLSMLWNVVAVASVYQERVNIVITKSDKQQTSIEHLAETLADLKISVARLEVAVERNTDSRRENSGYVNQR